MSGFIVVNEARERGEPTSIPSSEWNLCWTFRRQNPTSWKQILSICRIFPNDHREPSSEDSIVLRALSLHLKRSASSYKEKSETLSSTRDISEWSNNSVILAVHNQGTQLLLVPTVSPLSFSRTISSGLIYLELQGHINTVNEPCITPTRFRAHTRVLQHVGTYMVICKNA